MVIVRSYVSLPEGNPSHYTGGLVEHWHSDYSIGHQWSSSPTQPDSITIYFVTNHPSTIIDVHSYPKCIFSQNHCIEHLYICERPNIVFPAPPVNRHCTTLPIWAASELESAQGAWHTAIPSVHMQPCSHAAAQKWSHAHQSSVVPFTRSPELWSFSERSLLRFPPLPLLHHKWKPLLFKNYHFITRKQFFLWMVVGQLPTFMAGLCW